MKRAILIALALSSSAVSLAEAAPKLVAPGDQPMVVKSAQLAIKSPGVNVCPSNAKIAGWIFTSKAGPVTYMIVRKGGAVSAPKTIQAIKAPAGYVASFSKTFEVLTAIDAEYRILVSQSDGVVSNWAPLKASCKIQLGG